MKELSIEEKARAYDRALAKAKEQAIDGYLDAVAVNDIFPELKESEGERIRKNIISYLALYKDAIGEEYESWIAWLEKQGEPVPDWMPKFLDELRPKKHYFDWDEHKDIEGYILAIINWMNPNYFNGKDGEQKPNFCHHEVDLSNCSEEYRKAYYDGWNNCNMQHSQFKSELDDVVKCLINGMKFYYEDNEEATWGTDKWSMPVKHIIEVLEAQGSQNFANSGRTCKDEQNRWKPSELQLECLDDAIKQYQSDGFCPVILMELLEDLKKLKEGKL